MTDGLSIWTGNGLSKLKVVKDSWMTLNASIAAVEVEANNLIRLVYMSECARRTFPSILTLLYLRICFICESVVKQSCPFDSSFNCLLQTNTKRRLKLKFMADNRLECLFG